MLFRSVSNQRAVVASRGDLAVLDFGSPGRDLASAPLGRRRLGVVGEYAQDPRSSALAVSPDGASVAVFDNEQSRLELRAVPGRPGRSLDAVELPIDGAVGSGYGPLWLADNTVAVLDPAGGPAPVRRGARRGSTTTATTPSAAMCWSRTAAAAPWSPASACCR